MHPHRHLHNEHTLGELIPVTRCCHSMHAKNNEWRKAEEGNIHSLSLLDDQ